MLRLIADGLTNEAISDDLGLALKTIEGTIRSIFTKIGLVDKQSTNRRVLAVRWFLESGAAQASVVRRPSSDLVGRTAELDDLERLIAAKKFVTVTGAGGIGKTRLAAELAMRRAKGTHARVVDLAAADDLSARQRVFDAFGLQLASDSAAMRLLARSLAAEPHFVIIDNAEHVLTAVRQIIPVLTSSPSTILVVTSREPLGVPGEQVWRTPPLSAGESALLLATRMREAGSSQTLDGQVLDSWCHALDGMPLAIELAARRLATLPADRLGQSEAEVSKFLQFGQRSRPMGLADVLHQSFARLPAGSRYLARSLAVFRGGFSLATAHQFAEPGSGADDSLSALVSSSFVEFNGSRFRMLEPVRQFIADQMTDSERRKAELGLIKWCADFIAMAESGFLHDPRNWRSQIEAEQDNVDASLDSAVVIGAASDALRIARGLGEFWSTGAAATAYRRLSVLLDSVDFDTSLTKAWALLAAGTLAASTRLQREAGDRLADALDLFRMHADAEGIACALYWLARRAGSADDLARSAELARSAGVHYVEGWAKLILARDGMRAAGRLETFIPLLEEAEKIARAHHLPQLLSNSQLLRAEIMLQANWLEQSTFSITEIDAVLAQVEAYNRHAGGAVQHTDYFSIATTTHLHHRRWDPARRSAREQLQWAQQTEDPVVISEAILMAAVVMWHDGNPEASRLVRKAGPTFAGWSGGLWLAFTVYPALDLYAEAAIGEAEDASVEELVSLAERALDALVATRSAISLIA